MFVDNRSRCIAAYAAILALACLGCADEKHGEIEESRAAIVADDTIRPLPFLAGQRVDVTQGQFGTVSHGASGVIKYGVDFAIHGEDGGNTARGLPVVAVMNGYVSEAESGIKDVGTEGCNENWGNSVVYCTGFQTGTCERAAHLREVFVKLGEFVKTGQVIGILGTSGHSNGPHLHAQRQGVDTCPRSLTKNTICNSISGQAQYWFKATKDGNHEPEYFNESPWGTSVMKSKNYTEPRILSDNEGLMGEKRAHYSVENIGNPTTPRNAADIGLHEGWNGYGWLRSYDQCDDADGDSDSLCRNEGVYRTNAYIRRFSGGNFGSSVIVYDVLNGATNSYLIRSGFLTDSSNGWDMRKNVTLQHNIEIGMPISDQYSMPYGNRQDFQWGWLKWDATNSLVSARKYDVEINARRSIGPGVFAPDNTVAEYYWNRQVSYRFVDAWNLHAGFNGIGEPYRDNGANAGVHVWAGTRFLVQNFTNPTYGESVIMYDPANGQYALAMTGSTMPSDGWNKAYIIRGVFWNWYRYNNGMSQLKAPISDEYVIGINKRQDFLCGHMEFNPGTNTMSSVVVTSKPGCGIPDPVTPTTYCYKPGTPSASNGNGTGGGSASEMVISCQVGPADMRVWITGPIQEGIFSSMYQQDDVFVEYGSDTDGWAPYTSGKPKNTWMGDWITAEVPRTYMFTLGANVQNMNFFMYHPSTGAVSWFDLDKWTITGDCWRDGGGIRHYVPPTATKTLACAVNGPDMTVTLTGPINQGIFGNPPSDNPTYIEYGSDTDGWGPYTTGKPKATWMSNFSNHTLIVSSSVQNFNFFMYGPSSGQVSWFDLNQWNITGDCWRDQGGIRHSMPPTTPKYIDCQVSGPDMTVTVTGPINQGIFGTAPTDNPTYIEYGSDSDGWAPYTTGKPKATWFNWLNAHTFILSASVQNMNFFMYGPTSGQVNWFDLNQWTITGRCWRDGGGIRHN